MTRKLSLSLISQSNSQIDSTAQETIIIIDLVVMGGTLDQKFFKLTFGMQHHLVDLYQVCSNNAHGTKNGHAQGSYILHWLI